MADQKVSQLPVATLPLGGTEIVPAVQGGITKRPTVQDIANLGVKDTYVHAQLAAHQSPLAPNAFNTILFGEITDTKGEYNPATGQFTAAAAGRYIVSAFVHVAGYANDTNFLVSVFKNGAESARLGEQVTSNPAGIPNRGSQIGSTCVMTLAAGDVLTVRAFVAVEQGSGTLRATGLAQLTYFSVVRIG